MATVLTPAQNLSVLKLKLKSYATKLQNIFENSKEVKNGPRDVHAINLFKGMYKALEPNYKDFNEVWFQIISICVADPTLGDFPDQTYETLLNTVDNYYYETCAVYEELNSGNMIPIPSSFNGSTSIRAHLPKINIATFSGAFSDWPLFRDTYVSIIHNEQSLSKIEKFHFLIGSLSGPARALVKSIPLSEDNYEQAWKTLQSHYDNKRKLANHYLDQILGYKPPSGKSNLEVLEFFMSKVSENVKAFKNLSIPNPGDYILFELAIRCLDSPTRQAFEINYASVEYPEFEDLLEFIRYRHQALMMVPQTKSGNYSPKPSPKFSKTSFSSSLFTSDSHSLSSHSSTAKSSNYSSCIICKDRHSLYRCQRFLAATPSQRSKLLKEHNFKGCRNCLSSSHFTSNCKSKHTCKSCHKPHHTLLHLLPKALPPKTSTSSSPDQMPAAPSQNDPIVTGFTSSLPSINVLLGTAVVLVEDAKGAYHKLRLVVDTGSQYGFITQRFADRLALRPEAFSGSISGVGKTKLGNASHKVNCTLTSFRSPSVDLQIPMIVVPCITSRLPQVQLPRELWEKYTSYDLADSNFWKPGPIDALVGADVFTDILQGKAISFGKNFPSLIPTMFGHIVMGRTGLGPGSEPSEGLSCFSVDSPSLDSVIHKFWEVEEVKQLPPIIAPEDEECEQFFANTVSRLASGRYVVALPFKNPSPTLGPSKQRALTRLYNLESQLSKKPQMKLDYCQFLLEYLQLGHMQPASSPGSYYIPHHGVYKSDPSSKIRVVFDASSKTSSGSLNDHLHTGPKLTNDICDVIVNFRRYPVVFCADIVKMYRQILVRESDHQYQHILWRPEPHLPVEDLELLTITYGTRSAQYLAIRTIHQLVKDEGSKFPKASQALLRDIYVDDIVSGGNSLPDAIALRNELIELLSKGCLELSKWCSNSPELLEGVGDQTDSPLNLSPNNNVGTKVLGLQWDPSGDVFSYQFKLLGHPRTKRQILSTIARMYDPLGFIAPVIFEAKYILQQVWKSGIQWDEEPPQNILTLWENFTRHLGSILSLKIPRHIFTFGSSHTSLISFCDGSQRGFCAVIYIKTVVNGTPRISLLKAKTKLCPIKPMTIPRIELCGALLLARLFKSIAQFLNVVPINHFYFFTDSTIVLAWLRHPPHLLKTFVSHRVVEILDATPSESWFHIISEDNPADCGSRGLSPDHLPHHSLWWAGPQWLASPESEWPLASIVPESSVLPDVKLSTVSMVTCQDDSLVVQLEHFSSYPKLVRIMAYILRFITKARKLLPSGDMPAHCSGPISSHEFSDANAKCILLVQKYYFHSSSRRNKDSFSNLGVFTGPDGLLRVGGRLSSSFLPYSSKHPILLPREASFTRSLVEHLHKSHHHPGIEHLLSITRQNYWIPSARKLIKSVRAKCLPCLRMARSSTHQLMGDLPHSRFPEGQRAFFHTGVDFAGPFTCRETSRRKSPLHKSYICLFICFASKALHLEVVPSLSTEGFLDALDRFIARRGAPARIFSDNATNFVGAWKYLTEVRDWLADPHSSAAIANHCVPKGIDWSFIPPRAPNFGGLWEAGIKSVKTQLYKSLGNQPYTERELSTLVTKIEGILNSRPLTHVSSDPADPVPLTPAHLLIGDPIYSLPEPNLLELQENRLSRWQFLRQRVQHFWKSWRDNYLHTLQQRQKWLKPGPLFKVGDVVLLKESDTPPFQWPLGIIEATHPGTDGVVRVSTVRTTKGTYKRPCSKLISLSHIVKPTSLPKT